MLPFRANVCVGLSCGPLSVVLEPQLQHSSGLAVFRVSVFLFLNVFAPQELNGVMYDYVFPVELNAGSGKFQLPRGVLFIFVKPIHRIPLLATGNTHVHVHMRAHMT